MPTYPALNPTEVGVDVMTNDALIPERRFSGVDRAYGLPVLERLANAHVVVAGIGGVGSWAVEALARSGLGELTLVDMDHVAESNINRQIHALQSTLGQAKVDAMFDRISQINPNCKVGVVDEFVTPDNVQDILPAHADIILDCTDGLAAKVAMVLCARSRAQSLIVCGAAGGKTDTLSLRAGDLRDTTHDALLARLRTTLRKFHGFASAAGRRPARLGVDVLWFSQASTRPASQVAGMVLGAPLSCAGYGSLVTVTATMGMAAAARAIDRIVRASPV
jgi:tRNA threonylcarbamoyladenosine dehydratase